MIRAHISNVALSICFAAVAALPSACSSGSAGMPSEHVGTGTLAMPLTKTANGNTYRLATSLFISGPTSTTLFTSNDPSETVLRASLQSGSYFAGLSSWSLEKQRADGTFAPVQASLASSSFVSFAIENGTTTTISFKFQTDGIIVEIGRGNLVVDVDVEEIAPVCTPLGSGCADGAWCPPPELTGTAIACAVAGPVAVGDPCDAPTDCVANATCIDLGEGPVCAALCASSAFEVACDSGGTCEAAGTTYGLCR